MLGTLPRLTWATGAARAFGRQLGLSRRQLWDILTGSEEFRIVKTNVVNILKAVRSHLRYKRCNGICLHQAYETHKQNISILKAVSTAVTFI